MPGSAYFLRQADICLRLSLVTSDEQVANRLIAMSLEYKAKAARLAFGMGTIASEIAGQDRDPDHEAERK